MNDMIDLDRTWRVCSRRILGVHERTHCNFIPSLMGTLTPSLEILNRMIKFFSSGHGHSSEIISFYFRNCFNYKASIMYRNLSFMARILNVNINNLLTMPKRDIKKKLNNLVIVQENWKIGLIKKLIDCKENFMTCNQNYNQVREIMDFLCTK